jgi:hypothetical protein
VVGGRRCGGEAPQTPLLKNLRALIGNAGRIAAPYFTNFADGAPTADPMRPNSFTGGVRGVVISALPGCSIDKIKHDLGSHRKLKRVPFYSKVAASIRQSVPFTTTGRSIDENNHHRPDRGASMQFSPRAVESTAR